MLSQTVPKNAAKRLLIIDAMNVMHMKMKTTNNSRSQKQLDCFSILPIMRYFVRRGHAVEVVMPEFCIYKKCFKNFYIWKDLNALKLLILVPYMMHDDLVALTVARDACGSVITQDKFRDHLACFPQLYRVRSRNIKLAFINDTEKRMFFRNSKGDKYYKDRFMCMNYAFEQFYSLPGDGDYDLVKEEKWSENRRKDVLKCIDKIYGLAEAQYMLSKVEQLPKFNLCSNPINVFSSTDIHEKIVRDGEKEKGISKNKNMKALLCWRNTAEKQELKYQLQERCVGAHQRYMNFSFIEDSLPICESSRLLTLQDENWKDDTSSKPISIVIKENAACEGFITETINLPSVEMSLKQKISKNDRHAESKAFLWKTLTDEVKVDGKPFYNFLSSFHGILEKEFMLNACYDPFSDFFPFKEEIINSNITEAMSTELCSLTSNFYPMMNERSNRSVNELDTEKKLMWELLVDELNLNSGVLYNILLSWDENPLQTERIVNAYFEHMNDWNV